MNSSVKILWGEKNVSKQEYCVREKCICEAFLIEVMIVLFAVCGRFLRRRHGVKRPYTVTFITMKHTELLS